MTEDGEERIISPSSLKSLCYTCHKTATIYKYPLLMQLLDVLPRILRNLRHFIPTPLCYAHYLASCVQVMFTRAVNTPHIKAQGIARK